MVFLRFALGLVVLLSLVGVHVYEWFRSQQSENQCLMTYMMPGYRAVNLSSHSALHSRYRLFLYTEQMVHAGAPSLSPSTHAGVPVLFIPGNSGSYKQVRSLGQEAFRMFGGSAEYEREFARVSVRAGLHEMHGLSRDTAIGPPNSLDFWTVDFNSELSAMSGRLLEQQVEFVADCIAYLQSAYQTRYQPRFKGARSPTVVLLGHSLGGIVALGALSHPRVTQLSTWPVSLVVTLATPHTPAISIDPATDRVYRSVLEHAAQVVEERKVVIVSLGGGTRDLLIPSRLARPLGREHAVFVDTLSIPTAHLETDHLSIAWCNQVVRALAGSLFASMNATTRLLYPKHSKLQRVFQKMLSGVSEAKRLGLLGGRIAPAPRNVTEIRRRLRLYRDEAPTLRYRISKVSREECLMVKTNSSFDGLSGSSRVTFITSAKFARVYHNSSAGLVEITNWMLDSPTKSWDDPRSQKIDKPQFFGRLFGQFEAVGGTQVLVCRKHFIQEPIVLEFCRVGDDISKFCAVQRFSKSAALKVSVNFALPSWYKYEFAVVYALNRADNQTRFLSALRSGDEGSVRFDSSPLGNADVELLIVFPAHSTNRTLRVEADYVSMALDATRPVLVSGLIFSAALGLVGIGAIGSIAALAASLFVLVLRPHLEHAFVFLFLVGLGGAASQVVWGISGLASKSSRNGSSVLFLIITLILGAGCGAFVSLSLAHVLVFFLIPFAPADASTRRRVFFLAFHTLFGHGLNLFSFLRLAVETNYAAALAEARLQLDYRPALFVLELVVLSGFGLPLTSSDSFLFSLNMKLLGVGMLLASVLFSYGSLVVGNAIYIIDAGMLAVVFALTMARSGGQSKSKKD